jgi:hypothetical protein
MRPHWQSRIAKVPLLPKPDCCYALHAKKRLTIGRVNHASALGLLSTYTIGFIVAFNIVRIIISWMELPSNLEKFREVPGSRMASAPWFTQEVANKVISTIHSVYACYGFLQHHRRDRLEIGEDLASLVLHMPQDRFDFLIWTVAYTLFDTLRLARLHWLGKWQDKQPKAMQRAMAIHHVVLLGAMWASMWHGFGTYYVGAYVRSEFSTPFLNGRFLLPTVFNLAANHPLVMLNDLAFVALFLVCRGYYNLKIFLHLSVRFWNFEKWIYARGAPYWTQRWVLTWCNNLFILVNMYWCAMILRTIYKAVTRAKKGHKKTDSGVEVNMKAQ